MQVLLLVAGQSKRFWPLEEKSLFPICGKTLLEHQMDRLTKAGCDDITIVANAQNAERVRAIAGGRTVLLQEDMELGTRGALLSALPHIRKEPVMIVSGNDLVEMSAYHAVLEASRQPGVDGVFLAKEMKTYFPGGYLSVSEMQDASPLPRITGIVEKPGEGNEPSNLVNIVVHIHNDYDALWQALQDIKDARGDGYSQAEQILLETKRYRAVTYAGSWQAVKYPWHLLEVMQLLLKDVTESSIHPTASVHPTAVLEGPVILDEGVVVQAQSVIVGPVYIGKRTSIAHHCLIRGGSIGADCVIGGRSEVKASALHSHVWTHGTYLGDSVSGENVSFGTGFVSGNLRLDEGEVKSAVNGDQISTKRIKFGVAVGNHVRIGFQVGTNPGVKIGKDTLIASGCLIEQDVPEGSFLRLKEGKIHSRPNEREVPRPERRDVFRHEHRHKG
jgi:UDP-N-acetylglucosamine diphosphorylase / glucose-1-phosphate thymidylyltransferase / UDP-N-acetylgalactosamine diphosphorylase / glucosamine-1-phosphate N-acetyltransferase / galactosamine-1-phosphate N-acetyltransferase